jgi:hypothetical protein
MRLVPTLSAKQESIEGKPLNLNRSRWNSEMDHLKWF